MRVILLAGAAALLALAASEASASWQLIPGKPYDGRYPLSVLKEPCWSAATSRCSWEQSRQQQKQVKPRRTR